MSIFLRPSSLKVKDANGNYIDTNIFAQESTQEYLNAIEAKGEETIASIPQDYTNLNNEVSNVKADLNHQIDNINTVVRPANKNLIDENCLLLYGWQETSGDYYGKVSKIHDINLPVHGFKENTQYSVTFSCYNATHEATTGNGIIFYFHYTDNTSSGVYCNNSITSFTVKTGTSEVGKTVKDVIFYAASLRTADDVWHIKNFQIEEGATATAYTPFEYTAVDSIARSDISDVNTQIRADFADVVTYSVGKNLFNGYDNNHKDGILVSTSGALSANTSYNSVVLPVEGGKSIVCNFSYIYFSFYTNYNDISAMSVGDSLDYNISGVVPSAIGQVMTVPANAKYMCVSYQPARIDSLQIEYGASVTSYEKYIEGIPSGDIFPLKPIVYNIYADGTGDYANLRSCLEAITDATERKPYEVHIHEGTYDIASLFTSEEIAQQSNNGLFVPNYVTLVGIGRRDNIILSCVLNSYSSYFSPIHFRNYGGMKNLTVTATKCRYTIHDDIAVNGIGGHRFVENCKIIGNDLSYGCVYGSGLKEDEHWEFINTVMDGSNASKGGGQGLVFLSHNQLGWEKPSDITFENCRFINGAEEGVDPTWKYAMRFRSLITDGTVSWNNMPVYIHIYGTLCNGIELGEDGNYGSGIAYWVDGYSNQNAWEHVTSTSDPIITTLDRFDMIGSY